MAQGLPTRQPVAVGLRAWWSVAVFVAAALYLYPFWQRVGLDSDEAKIILGGMRVLQGERLYVDIFAFLPPGLYVLVTAVLRLTQPAPDIYWLRLAVVLMGAGSVAGTWAMAARGTGRPLLALLPALWTGTFGLSLWCITSAHWISTTFAVFTTWAMMEVGVVRAPWRPWFLAGLGIGGTLLFAQHKGIALGGVAVLLVAVYIVHAIRRLQRPRSQMAGPEDALALGIAFVVAPVCIGLASRGAFVPMMQAAFGWTVEGYGVANRVPYGYLADVLFSPPRWLVGGAGVGRAFGFLCRGLMLYAAPACLAVLVGRGVRRWVRNPEPAGWADMTVGLSGLVMWATTLTRPDILHVLTVGPWLFTAPVMLCAPRPGTRPRGAVLWGGGGAVAAAVLVAAMWGAGDHLELRRWSTARLGGLGFVRFPHAVAPNFTAADSPYGQTVAYLRMVTLPEEPIFVYPYAPYFYYLANRSNATRYNICFPGYQGAAAIAEVIDSLEEQAVPYVVLDPMSLPAYRARAFPGYAPTLFTDSPLTQYINRRYTLTARFGDVRVMKRRTR